VPDPAARLGWDAIIGRRLQQSFLSTRARKRQIVDVVRSTCGIQAQSPPAAELALGLRVDPVDFSEREILFKERLHLLD